jgi:hypothetical protein
MTIKENPSASNQARPIHETNFADRHPLVLNTEESEALLHAIAEAPAPLSPEMKAAIANYRRIKAQIIKDTREHQGY